jgi:hypothetical protein
MRAGRYGRGRRVEASGDECKQRSQTSKQDTGTSRGGDMSSLPPTTLLDIFSMYIIYFYYVYYI